MSLTDGPESCVSMGGSGSGTLGEAGLLGKAKRLFDGQFLKKANVDRQLMVKYPYNFTFITGSFVKMVHIAAYWTGSFEFLAKTGRGTICQMLYHVN